MFKGVYITLSTVALVENEVASGETGMQKRKQRSPPKTKQSEPAGIARNDHSKPEPPNVGKTRHQGMSAEKMRAER